MKVLGVLGGHYMPPQQVSRWCATSDCIIAADSGISRVFDAGYSPDYVTGDFDSFPVEVLENFPRLVHDPDQNTTDFEKLLSLAESLGFFDLTVICTEGDLVDHMLDVIHSSTRTPINVRIGMTRGIALILKGPTSLSVPTTVGRRVSLLPIENARDCSLNGVRWPFANEDLSPSGFSSISNQAVSSLISVTLGHGSAYLFTETDSEPVWN